MRIGSAELSEIDPVQYHADLDLLKHAGVAGPAVAAAADFAVDLDLAVLVAFSAAALAVAGVRFSRETANEPLLHRLARKQSD